MVDAAGERESRKGQDLLSESVFVTSVELDGRRLLAKEAESAFAVGLVLRAKQGGADTHGVAEDNIDMVGMVGRLVVEEYGERWLSGGIDTTLERVRDGVAVFDVGDVTSDPCRRMRVDEELEVEAMHFPVDKDIDLLAVSHPLRSGKEGFESVACCFFVGRATRAPFGNTCTVLEEQLRDHGVAEVEMQVMAHVLSEGSERSSLPPPPGIEEHLDLGHRGVGGGVIDALYDSVVDVTRAQPVFEGAERDPDGLRERRQPEVGMTLA